MKILFGVLSVFFILANTAICDEGIDYVFRKPHGRKTWGQQLADYVGYGGYTKSYAIVIGISVYDSYDTLPTKNDPIRVKNFLLNVAGFDYVHLLTEEKATILRIRDIMVDTFPNLIDENDRFLFYWSGHGVTRLLPKGKGIRGYLPLKSTPKNKYSEMIGMNNIKNWDDLLKAKQTLYLLDSCFSGLAGVKPKSSDMRQLTIGQMARPSRHLITAGTEGQQTIAVDSLGGSVFTTAVLDGLRGAADTTTSVFERDGLVSVHELVDYVKKRVALECKNLGWKKSITPQPRDLTVNEGEFFFITGEYKANRMEARGLHITHDFKYGEPVPMSGERSPSTENAAVHPLFSTELVRQTQTRLQQIGLNPGPVDGIWGPSTSEALRRFQARVGLDVTGELNRATWEILIQKNEKPAAGRSEKTNNIVGAKNNPNRGWIGVQLVDINEEGAYVKNVVPGNPADQAGIRSGDVIVSVNGQKVASGKELAILISSIPAGQLVEIVLLRNGNEKTVLAILGERPAADIKTAKSKSGISDDLGFQVTDLSVENIRQFGSDKGVLVIEVKNGSRADEAGIKVGDVIKGINRKNIENLKDYESFMINIDRKKPIHILVHSQGQGFRAFKITP